MCKNARERTVWVLQSKLYKYKTCAKKPTKHVRFHWECHVVRTKEKIGCNPTGCNEVVATHLLIHVCQKSDKKHPFIFISGIVLLHPQSAVGNVSHGLSYVKRTVKHARLRLATQYSQISNISMRLFGPVESPRQSLSIVR